MTKTDNFIKKSYLLHNDRYDYSLVEYIKSSEKVNIICPLHGKFQQTPNNHLKGQGCRKCVIDNHKSNTIDFIKKSIEIHGNNFIYGNPEIYRGDVINKTINKTFGFLYEKTLKKEQILKDAGYNVKSIWEKDFKLINKIKYRYNV